MSYCIECHAWLFDGQMLESVLVRVGAVFKLTECVEAVAGLAIEEVRAVRVSGVLESMAKNAL